MTEFEDEQLNFDVQLTGQKGAGRSCVVTVSTLEDSATGTCSLIHVNLKSHTKSTVISLSVLCKHIDYF